MNDYTVVIKVEICECKDKQEAIDFVADNIAYNVVSSQLVPQREFVGLKEISDKFKHIKKLYLLSKTLKTPKEEIHFLEIETFLANNY